MNKMNITDAWSKQIQVPNEDNLRRIGCANFGSFVNGGTLIAQSLLPIVEAHLDSEGRSTRVLDFGCGIGRVALPMHHYLGVPTHCSDIDGSAVRYLETALPSAECKVNAFNPPLPFEDNQFDLVYSISIWTHLSLEMQEPWIREVHRVLRPGGVALISTSSYAALKTRRRKGIPSWVNVTDEQLKDDGIIYTESKYLETKKENFPGVTGSYGMTAHDPDWIRNNWSDIFEILDIRAAAIAGTQDLSIMKKG